MQKFTRHQGIAAPLMRINVDTDAIIPSREMKRVSKQGLGEGLFAGWRYIAAGGREPNPEFVLNRAEYQGATVLLSGLNFGCGSSREHAVWALKEYGFRAIIAAGFGTIFYGNCIRNGILPIVLPNEVVNDLAVQAEQDPSVGLLVDLPQQQVVAQDGKVYSFEIEAANKEMLVEGLDPIAVTLKREAQISAYEARQRQVRPWLFQTT